MNTRRRQRLKAIDKEYKQKARRARDLGLPLAYQGVLRLIYKEKYDRVLHERLFKFKGPVFNTLMQRAKQRGLLISSMPDGSILFNQARTPEHFIERLRRDHPIKNEIITMSSARVPTFADIKKKFIVLDEVDTSDPELMKSISAMRKACEKRRKP